MSNQITPELLELMADIIGGLAGETASSIATMQPSTPQAPQEQPPAQPQQPPGQPTSPKPTPSPYEVGWHKHLTKKQGRHFGSVHPPTTPEGPSAPFIKPTDPPKVTPLSISDSTKLPSHPSFSQPAETLQAPKVQPPQDQHAILEAVKREAQNYNKPNIGTNLAHWLRTHYTNRSVTSQFEAAGVDSLDDLAQILSNGQEPLNAVNLDLFHDDNSPFAVISEPRQDFQSGGIPAVVVGPPYVSYVHQLEEAFPGVHFMAVEEAAKELEEAASVLAKPLPTKSVKPSPYGYRKKAQEPPENAPTKPQKPEPAPNEQSTKPDPQNPPQQKPKQTLQPEEHEAWKLQRTPGALMEEAPAPQENLEEIVFGDRTTEQRDPDVLPEPTEEEREATFQRELSSFADYYTRTYPLDHVNYNAPLPSEEEIASAPMESLWTGSLHSSHIGTLNAGGTKLFYKGNLDSNAVVHEVRASTIGTLLGIPIPHVGKSPTKEDLYVADPHLVATATSWIDGPSLKEVVSGLEARVPSRMIYQFLSQLLYPGDIDRQIFFPYWLCIEDRHLGQYAIAGNRLVTFDHEFVSPERHRALPFHNDIFSMKFDGTVGSGGDWQSTLLDRGIAWELASHADDVTDALKDDGVSRPDYIYEVARRGKILRRFAKGKRGDYKTLLDFHERER